MTYNRRDLIGHWVRKQQPTQRMCGHACCRGMRGKDTRLGTIYTPPKRKRGYRAAYKASSLRKAA